jgi:hypothetical protein
MILYKGQFISFVQYMMAKPIKHGLKVFAMCCSHSGYLFTFEVYLGKDNTDDGTPMGIVMRMLRDANMGTRGRGRTLVTDNWYSSGQLMANIYKEFGMSFIGTINLTSKKTRTADSFPYHKLSNGALKKAPRGWFRSATQNVIIGGKIAYTMQATVWKDKKQVAMLHNVDVLHKDQNNCTTLRWSPRKKQRREVSSPKVINTYNANYNGVDRKDRDTADWSISLKSNRWYLRVYYWMLDSVIHAAFLVVSEVGKKRSEREPDHPWAKYGKKGGRWKFQLDLAHSLLEKGILLDCPDIGDLKDKKKRPRYMRRTDFHPCSCGVCFFCKSQLTHGVAHKPYNVPRFRIPVPNSPPVPAPLPSQHPEVAQPMKQGYCNVCENREKKKKSNSKMTLETIRKLPSCKSTSKGCPQCKQGRGVKVCIECWKSYTHDL